MPNRSQTANCKHGVDVTITNSKVDPSQRPWNDL